jgi:hypothetical protein
VRRDPAHLYSSSHHRDALKSISASGESVCPHTTDRREGGIERDQGEREPCRSRTVRAADE